MQEKTRSSKSLRPSEFSDQKLMQIMCEVYKSDKTSQATQYLKTAGDDPKKLYNHTGLRSGMHVMPSVTTGYLSMDLLPTSESHIFTDNDGIIK